MIGIENVGELRNSEFLGVGEVKSKLVGVSHNFKNNHLRSSFFESHRK